jgi:hypothetical protein
MVHPAQAPVQGIKASILRYTTAAPPSPQETAGAALLWHAWSAALGS